jgi:hypothetical protein
MHNYDILAVIQTIRIKINSLELNKPLPETSVGAAFSSHSFNANRHFRNEKSAPYKGGRFPAP